jgi:hypothetical protein
MTVADWAAQPKVKLGPMGAEPPLTDPIEKIMRDARASMIEDGCNEVLAIKGGYYLMDERALG